MKPREILLHNIRLKAAALLLALVSWYAIRQTINFELTVHDIPVDIRVDEGWSVLQQSVDTVSATFRGAQEDIRLMDPRQMRAVAHLDPSAVDVSEYVEMGPRNITGFRGVRVIQVIPDRIRVSLDREAQKRIPVKARAAGRLASGEIESMTCDPAIVTLRGPARQLELIDVLYTEPVDLEGRQSSFRKRSRIMPPSNIWVPNIDPPEVQVNVNVASQTESHTWQDVPVTALTEPGRFTRPILTPARVNVTLSGRAETVEDLRRITPRVFVDCTALDPSLTYELPVIVHLPPGTPATAAADPPIVRIVIEGMRSPTQEH